MTSKLRKNAWWIAFLELIIFGILLFLNLDYFYKKHCKSVLYDLKITPSNPFEYDQIDDFFKAALLTSIFGVFAWFLWNGIREEKAAQISAWLWAHYIVLVLLFLIWTQDDDNYFTYMLPFLVIRYVMVFIVKIYHSEILHLQQHDK